MKAIADINLVVIGGDVSISRYVAACVQIMEKRRLKTYLHALGTNVEGELSEVLEAVEMCHQLVHRMGAVRVVTTIKLATRTDRDQSIEEKISSVADKRIS